MEPSVDGFTACMKKRGESIATLANRLEHSITAEVRVLVAFVVIGWWDASSAKAADLRVFCRALA
ncbi:hypothetical protein, partial [Xanthomonas arboricola]|uniref:hypothetical protein n=1 Tax=Xanthomonas arboricola TaxID=56448 RepID=UPI001955F10B